MDTRKIRSDWPIWYDAPEDPRIPLEDPYNYSPAPSVPFSDLVLPPGVSSDPGMLPEIPLPSLRGLEPPSDPNRPQPSAQPMPHLSYQPAPPAIPHIPPSAFPMPFEQSIGPPPALRSPFKPTRPPDGPRTRIGSAYPMNRLASTFPLQLPGARPPPPNDSPSFPRTPNHGPRVIAALPPPIPPPPRTPQPGPGPIPGQRSAPPSVADQSQPQPPTPLLRDNLIAEALRIARDRAQAATPPTTPIAPSRTQP